MMLVERSNGGSVRWGDTTGEEQWGQLEGEVLMKLWHAPTFPLPLHGNVKRRWLRRGGVERGWKGGGVYGVYGG